MDTDIFANLGERKAGILYAALGLFARYGVRRTSMEDIAQEAGLSRAALYQYFRNKEDILRHGVTAYFDAAEAELREALQPGLPVEEAVAAGCVIPVGGLAEALLDSPHGEELLSLADGTANALAEDGRARIRAVWANWLAGESQAGRIVLPPEGPEQVAGIIEAGQYGQKTVAANYADYLARLKLFAQMIARALRP